MKINIVTMWYNEEFFAPFFLSHYDYVDKIHVFIDADTNDRTREICEATPNVVIHSIQFKDGLDDEYRFTVINDFIATLTCDWVYVLDADEFIFPKDFENPVQVLARQGGNVMYANMYHVYKHHTEKALDINDKPVILQRRHGSYKCTNHGFNDDAENTWYRKPIIFRAGIGISYPRIGTHWFNHNEAVLMCLEEFSGAHWNMADVDVAINRRITHMRDRQSARNIELHQNIYWDDTEERTRRICELMLNEPQIF